MPDHENPWKEPVAKILSPADIHLAADPETGQPPVPSEQIRDAVPSDSWRAMLMPEEQYRKAGSHYLAGSGTAAFGTTWDKVKPMPKIDDYELEVLSGSIPH
jgi:hypothetical protein